METSLKDIGARDLAATTSYAMSGNAADILSVIGLQVKANVNNCKSQEQQQSSQMRTSGTPSIGATLSRTSYSSEISVAEAKPVVKELAAANTTTQQDEPELTWATKIKQRLTRWLSRGKAFRRSDESEQHEIKPFEKAEPGSAKQHTRLVSSSDGSANGCDRKLYSSDDGTNAPCNSSCSNAYALSSSSQQPHERTTPTKLIKSSSERTSMERNDRSSGGGSARLSPLPMHFNVGKDDAEEGAGPQPHCSSPAWVQRGCMGSRLQNSRSVKFLMNGSLSVRSSKEDTAFGSESYSVRSSGSVQSLHSFHKSLSHERAPGSSGDLTRQLGLQPSCPLPSFSTEQLAGARSRRLSSVSPNCTPPGGNSPARRRGSMCTGNGGSPSERRLRSQQPLLSQPPSPTIQRTGSAASSPFDPASLPPLPFLRNRGISSGPCGPDSCPLPTSRQASISSTSGPQVRLFSGGHVAGEEGTSMLSNSESRGRHSLSRMAAECLVMEKETFEGWLSPHEVMPLPNSTEPER